MKYFCVACFGIQVYVYYRQTNRLVLVVELAIIYNQLFKFLDNNKSYFFRKLKFLVIGEIDASKFPSHRDFKVS